MTVPLAWVDPFQINGEDLEWLQKADEAGPLFHAIPAQRLFEELYQHKMHLFRFVPGPGVLLVEQITSASGVRRLNLVRAGGRGVGWTFRQLAEALQHLARDWGCAEVQSMVYSRKLAEAMRRVGARPEAVCMVMEVGDAAE